MESVSRSLSKSKWTEVLAVERQVETVDDVSWLTHGL